MNGMVACLRCGAVARVDSFEGARRRCPECDGDMTRVTAEAARKLVAARRLADERRRREEVSAEIGLGGEG